MGINFKNALDAALNHLRDGSYEEAISKIEQVLSTDNMNVRAWSLKALYFRFMNNFDKEIEALDKALEIEPKNPELWKLKGMVLGNKQDFNAALDSLNHAIEANANDATLWGLKARVLFALFRYDEALQCANKTIELNPNDSVAWQVKGALPKGFSRIYGYVRSRQLEGTYNNDCTIGVWPITALRVERGWGNPGEEKWPYDSSWPPKEPPHIDQYAKENRLFAYQRIRSVNECKEALFLRNSPILLSVDMTKEWRNAINGQIPLPQKEDKIIAGHAVLVTGYDDKNENLKFDNCWGVDWGDKGLGYLPYEYFNRYLSEAWVDIRPKPIDIAKHTEFYSTVGGVMMEWYLPSVLHDIIYGAEIRDAKSDDRKAWGFAFEYDGYLNVEELFVKPKWREGGYCKQLISSFERISRHLSIPLRFWISHPDSNVNNVEILLHIADKYGYYLSNSGVRWADYKIEKS